MKSVAGDHLDDIHDSRGHGAGLVEHDGVDRARALQDFGTLDQQSQLGAATGAYQESGWRGQSERTRAGDDQHRYGRGDDACPATGVADPEPERRRSQDDDDRHEDRGDSIERAAGREPFRI